MARIRHQDASPNVPALVQALAGFGVSYVVVGSAAAQLRGLDIAPRDFDIVPALDVENLTRLTQLLLDLEASVALTELVGEWCAQSDGEKKWVSRKATPAEQLALLNFEPRPDCVSLDRSYYTRLGNLDVVPSIAGDYNALCRRAGPVAADGATAFVAHVDDLLATLTIPRRPRDASRVRGLRQLQRAVGQQ